MIGVVLFAVAMFVWLGISWRAMRRGDAATAEYALPAFAGIIAWSLIAITDNPFDSYMYYTQYVGFLVGATIAMRAMTAKEQHVDRRLS